MRNATFSPKTRSGSAAAQLSPAELDGLSAYGRRDHTFDTVARHVLGLRFLLLAHSPHTDRHAREGLERAEAVALLSLALEPSATLTEHRQREVLFDGGCASGFENLSSMLAASLTADAARLTRRSDHDAWPEWDNDGPNQINLRRKQAVSQVRDVSRDGRARD